jgi:hypothetical protein
MPEVKATLTCVSVSVVSGLVCDPPQCGGRLSEGIISKRTCKDTILLAHQALSGRIRKNGPISVKFSAAVVKSDKTMNKITFSDK